jgi:CIC family chloride channel protein
MLPLMLASVVAYFVARLVGDRSMYEITVKRSRDANERSRLRDTQMHALMKPPETMLPIDAPFSDVTSMFVRFPVKYVYVVDSEDRFLGAIALQDVTALLLGEDTSHEASIEQLMHRDFQVLTADMGLSDALQLFLTHPGERLPVVTSHEDPKLIGVVYKSVLLDAYVRLSATSLA